MTPNALTALLALIALPMPAMAGQRTIYTNDGNVVCRYTTDREGTKAFQDRVHSSAARHAWAPRQPSHSIRPYRSLGA